MCVLWAKGGSPARGQREPRAEPAQSVERQGNYFVLPVSLKGKKDPVWGLPLSLMDAQVKYNFLQLCDLSLSFYYLLLTHAPSPFTLFPM